MDFFATTVWEQPLEEYPFVIERKRELESLRRALFDTPSHTAAVQGYYGVGKTFLAKLYAEKYRYAYAGGIRYFPSPIKAQDFLERGLEAPISRDKDRLSLFIIDETASLDHDAYLLRKFFNRYVRLTAQPNIHILFIGKTVPELLIRGGDSVNLDVFGTEELSRSMAGYIQASPFPEYLWADVIAKSQGNMRELYNLFYLLSQKETAPSKGIIYQSGILDANGQPLKKRGNPIELDVTAVNTRLLSDLAQRPELLYSLSSRELEFLIAELVEREGYRIMATKATRDGGVDIYAAKKDRVGSFLFLIEYKKNRPDRPVGVNVIRNLYGVMQHERATYSMVATTSFFTKGAIAFQQTIPHQMSLCDYHHLVAWLNAHQ